MEIKRKILSSTLGKKIIFEGNSGRTPVQNTIVTLLTKFKADLQGAENRTSSEKRSLLRLVTPEEHCSNQVASFFKDLFELRHDIQVEPLSLDSSNKIELSSATTQINSNLFQNSTQQTQITENEKA